MSRMRIPLTGAVLAGLLFTTAMTAGPARAATVTNRNYVVNLYADLLDREVGESDPGVAYWAGLLDAGRARTDVARAIQNAGEEFYGRVIDAAYLRYLDRTADAGGRSYYIGGWRSRAFTLEQVTAVIVGSNEYFDLHDSQIDAFIDATYFDILGRRPDPAGRAYFRDIARSLGRNLVPGVLATSAEHRRNVIRFAFAVYLGRSATDTEIQDRLNRLQAGLRTEELDVGIVGSAEYYDANS